ncbi:HI1506-related protein [Pseudomonas aeruginosa]|uniref:HI1506-related protein n=1 Tax=Pseudomonas aeruginosa TaxID=287 RepID=UPI000BB676EF|nr:HI1506-related protein [Pseudomonas aeruginosa]AXR09998.1 hypothetical protein DZ899_07350 [Pseudomonas aeruginosa]EIU2598537.1 hypothetical protein [Pseudomonas aeruginosa]EIU2879837.1 hypothetical protein [Pseudomonas aeruginosa]ELC7283654.1 hypothetical protein [Pseudomonas aeruginosa]ELK4865878.1 hypothetical protein [Pseudomonas aeruginosa]
MAIRITPRHDGFRRLGIAFPEQGLTFPDDRFTPDQLQVLKGERMLIVEEGVADQEDGHAQRAQPPQQPKAPAPTPPRSASPATRSRPAGKPGAAAKPAAKPATKAAPDKAGADGTSSDQESNA